MNKIKILTAITLIMGLSFLANNALGQRGQGRLMERPNRQAQMGECLLDLTPEQSAKISELRTNHLKEVTPLRNELGEKRARLRTLQSADKHDLNAINKTIDEMASLRATIQKKGAAHRAAVATQLTDEQRVNFNARKSNRMERGKGTMGRGFRNF